MNEVEFKKPILICLYGLPGSGKSYVARNLATDLPLAHVSPDRIRFDLFGSNKVTQSQESAAVKLAIYQINEFLRAGTSVVYDGSATTRSDRRHLREIAGRHKAAFIILWLQMDEESAFGRAATRDKRTLEGKYAASQTRTSFNRYRDEMHNPDHEEALVLSGKHTFASQKSAVISRLYQMGVVDSSAVAGNVVKPELVNLVPNFPRPLPTQLHEQDLPQSQ